MAVLSAFDPQSEADQYCAPHGRAREYDLLDPAATTAIEGLLAAVRSDGVPVVLITHDLGQARRLADQVAFLHHGRLIERTPSAAFFAKPHSPQAQAFVRGELVL